MRKWLAQHARSFISALTRLAGSPLNTALNVLVLGIALSLPLGLYILVDNLRVSLSTFSGRPQLSVFLDLATSRAEIAKLEARLKQHTNVKHVELVSRDQALQKLKQSTGLSDVIETLPVNPLPDAFIVNVSNSEPAQLETMREELAQWPHVAHVQLDQIWARRLDAAMRLARFVSLMLGALLAAAMIAVTFNTIRMQVLTQHAEIEVVQLIGATAAFVRLPFLYYGAFLGIAAGVVAWLIVALAIWGVNTNLEELSQLYGVVFELRSLPWAPAVVMLVLAGFLGWVGARLAAGQHITVPK